MAHPFSYIQINHNSFFIILSSLIIITALYFLIKKQWNVKEFGIVVAPLTLLILAAFLPGLGFSLPEMKHGEISEDSDYTIYMIARIQPWVFNITWIEDENGESLFIKPTKYEAISAGIGYPETVAFTTLELQVGKVYHLILIAIDTDHGFKIEGLSDYFGKEIAIVLPQQVEINVFFKPTEDDIGTYHYLCTFKCGKDHFIMNGQVIISL